MREAASTDVRSSNISNMSRYYSYVNERLSLLWARSKIDLLCIRLKDYEKQEKRLKELKAAGQSKKKAESKQKEALTRSA